MSKTNSRNFTLQSCELQIGTYRIIGFLFMQTKNHYVLVNNVRSGIDWGPLKSIKQKHIDPECHVSVFPKDIVDDLTKFQAKKKIY